MGNTTKLTQTVTKFRGINQFVSKTALSPEYADDCRNVLVNEGGYLSKVRIPVAFTQEIVGQDGPIHSFVNYQMATGVRQIIAHFDAGLVMFDADLLPTVIDTDPLNNPVPFVPFDYVEAHNLLFMANNARMIKWNGSVIQNWGIAKPIAPPTITVLGGNIDAAPVGAVRAANVTTFQTLLPHGLRIGDSVTTAGVTDPTFDYTKIVASVPDATHFTVADAQPNANSGAGTVVVSGGTAILSSKRWGYSYGNSVTGHESSVSDQSALLGPVAVATKYRVTPFASPDAQVDTLFIYSVLDGGGDLFLESTIPLGVDFTSTGGDAALNTAARAQLINDPPPIGKYLTSFIGRVFIFNLVGGTHTIAYTGLEYIQRGRPEESCPPRNRLVLDIGADQIRGGGVIQSGVIAFSASNEMFMFRGIVEDIVLDAPVLFTAFLEQLPFSEGLTSHYTCQSTPIGLIYFASDLNVKVFNGVGAPKSISDGIHPILRTITKGSEEKCVGCFFNYVDRDWYALLLPTQGSVSPNLIVIFDLSASDNYGCFIINQQADWMGVIEDAQSGRHLCFSNGGQLYELRTTNDTIGGVTPQDQITSTVGLLPAFWRGGYFGNDTPQMVRMWRFGRLIADQTGFSVLLNLINDNEYTFRNPLVMNPGLDPIGGKFSVNQRQKRVQVQINFPDQDISANVQQLQMLSIPLSDR